MSSGLQPLRPLRPNPTIRSGGLAAWEHIPVIRGSCGGGHHVHVSGSNDDRRVHVAAHAAVPGWDGYSTLAGAAVAKPRWLGTWEGRVRAEVAHCQRVLARHQRDTQLSAEVVALVATQTVHRG